MKLEYVSQNLVNLRQSMNWTQDDMAKELNVSRQAFSKWENGISLPNLEILLSLSKIFNITINEILEPRASCINDFEELTFVDTCIIDIALSVFNTEDIVTALKGASPNVNKLIKSIHTNINYDNENIRIGRVKITDVENRQKCITHEINRLLQQSDEKNP